MSGRRRNEVEITYSVLVDGVEIGFGTSGESASVDDALHIIHTNISLGQWEPVRGGETSG